VRGFDKQLWVCEAQTETSVTLTLVSADGDEGYPGRLLARVTYSLPSESQLKIEYTASADRPTLVNLTNHTYWNLFDGGRRAGVLEHEVEVAADFYTPVDAESIPTGEVRHVSGAMDLRERVAIGAGVRAADNGNGYDHNYVVRSAAKGDDGLRPAARVWEPRSGRWMSVRTDQPGVQFYTGNYLGGIRGRDGALFKKHAGFCLETQGFPNSANTAHFPSLVLRPGQEYSHTTIHEFGASKAPPTGPF
jgi:aldose 1-epimerase